MKRRFSDDVYAVRIAEWEKERIPSALWQARSEWGVAVLIAGVMLLGVGGRSLSDYGWFDWVRFAFVGFLALHLFVFLHEINENVRFVRHKLEAQRQAFEKVADELRRYKNPDSVNVFQAIDALDREWYD